MNNILRHGFQHVALKYFNNINSHAGSLVRQISLGSIHRQQQKEKIHTFDEFVNGKRCQASRSIVVQVSSEKSFPELYTYCADFGTIIDAQHYRMYHEEVHYILIEFSTEEEAMHAIDSSAYNEDLSGVPVRSPFLWFKASGKKNKTQQCKRPLVVVEGTRQFQNEELSDLLRVAENLDKQIEILHQSTKLNDLGVRLRFLAALQIESSISGMFPAANAQPFGSTVNGFGKTGCDLDLILRLDFDGRQENKDSRLVYHTKENLTNGRSQIQRQMESIGDMMHLFLPGVCHVRKILQARVPILKYHHEHLNLEVDLSMNNLSGFYMSELLYMFGEMDDRVRPLTFCIRKWAQSCGLTNPSPGRWISNFSLTCLVIFFLQQMKNPLLPSINLLMKSARPEDMRITEDGINCTFRRDWRELPFKTKNTSRTSELLLQFFEFYSQFDFANRGISLNEGKAVSKPDHAALYIINPLEQLLNVSKNVSLEECERIRIEVRNAAWVLESELENQTLPENDHLKTEWGVLNLFKTPEHAIIRPNMFFKQRMVEVRELFNDSEARTVPMPNMEFKNNSVKQHVQSVKLKGKGDIKQMRLNFDNESSKRRRR
ncbi:poly(A) RNA polymerase, mitochondrial isoform X1 [Episyrphus balteatus]|uniref:poly(A) RNA polymerase, mitochondrial isoform X1 n=2 Tax=Episyrphus balteatus TaxID=286459 RepID=UPI002486A53D|nr:poly(A) RNA polymerase, mitochondrial isoform X1 [Episyrphus balteatus]